MSTWHRTSSWWHIWVYVAYMLGTAMLALTTLTPAWPAMLVPAEYADLYAMLDGKLKAIEGIVTSGATGAGHDVVSSAELLPANANLGEGLVSERPPRNVI